MSWPWSHNEDTDLVGVGIRHLKEGKRSHRIAAVAFTEALRRDPALTQKAVSERAIAEGCTGFSESSVSRILKWHRDGAPWETVFGPEIAARRAAKKEPEEPDPQMWFEFMEDAPQPIPPDELDAFSRVERVRAACRVLHRELPIADDVVRLAFRTRNYLSCYDDLTRARQALERKSPPM